jgi:hypothetical protein
MNKYSTIAFAPAIFFIFNTGLAQKKSFKPNSNFMVRHTVVFKLKQSKDSVGVQHFFEAARRLANIPGVQNFECLKQTSKKNNFEYGLSMEFATHALYEQYTNHPDHVNFVNQYWLKEVEDFMEIDYEPFK